MTGGKKDMEHLMSHEKSVQTEKTAVPGASR
ncbi:hypothetical protein Pvag_pPag20092 (plasmid) [Pantoea vagans C9-1]|nr:hypothetical protein Pvag_pPag20092 [Pantoea vagans C9-1]